MGSTGRRLQQKSEQESRSVSVEGRKEESRIIPSLTPDTHQHQILSFHPGWVTVGRGARRGDNSGKLSTHRHSGLLAFRAVTEFNTMGQNLFLSGF